MATETLLDKTEFTSPSEALDRFVSEKLQKRDTVDMDGIIRPAFMINGREIVFRTRQEAPLYDDVNVMVPGDARVYPIERQVWDDETNSYKQSDETATRKYIDAHQSEAPRIVVTNTPEGMLTVAALLVESDEDSRQLMELADTFTDGKTWTESQRDAVDTMLAALSINDDGEPGEYLNMDGWALALAAFCGDSEAKTMVADKREALIEGERDRASDPRAAEKLSNHLTERGIEITKPIPLEQLALVHSTSYDIQRDETGAVLLRSAAQQRSDKFPRASLHFTLNSIVGSVTANLKTETWSDKNKIIVANFKKAIDAAHKLPNVMDGVDTWFTLNPGEAIRLPDAIVVEQVDQTASGQIIELTDTGVQYVLKDEYTIDEERLLRELGEKYNTQGIVNIALRSAMAQQGVPVELMDRPSSDGHGMYSHEIDSRVHATAAALGLPGGKHFDAPESNMENDAYYYTTLNHAPKTSSDDWYYVRPRASIEARRQTLASGFLPAVPMPEYEQTDEWGGV